MAKARVQAAMPSNDGVQDGNSLEESLSIVRSSKSRMVQCLDNAQLMDGLKHASTMLSELRTSSLGPKQYYELCNTHTVLQRHH